MKNNSRKKIIILHSTAGMGHKKAALALLKAFEDSKKDLDIDIVDVMEYANKVYRFLYLGFYVFLMSKARWLWGFMYYFSNNPFVDLLTRNVRGILDYVSSRNMGKMLVEKSPDAIVATHFFIPSIAGILKRKKTFKAKLFALMTDYGPHSFWLSKHMDMFFVGSEFASRGMIKRGVPSEKVKVTGIATTEEFNQQFDVDGLKEKYKLDKSKKTVFMMSGGFGVGPMEEMLMSLNSCNVDIQVITVCGHNKMAFDNVKSLEKELKYPVIVFGFTDKVAELMAISDVMVTKAGGISVTEALNSSLPMILFASVPGQETWNEEFLVSEGAAEKAKKVEDIPVIVNKILLSEEVYCSMKEAISKVRRPNAAKDIVDVVLSSLKV